MAENKTKPTKVSVTDFLKRKATPQQLADSRELIKMFSEITGSRPKMWGPSIVGFGSYHYVYESGREGDAPLLGFSPRKPEMVLYVMPCGDPPGLRKKLGKCRTMVSCIYVKKLDDIDRAALKELAQASVRDLQARYPAR